MEDANFQHTQKPHSDSENFTFGFGEQFFAVEVATVVKIYRSGRNMEAYAKLQKGRN